MGGSRCAGAEETLRPAGAPESATAGAGVSTIDYLPVWKKGASVHERLYELAEMARKHPERFDKWLIAYQELRPNGNTLARVLFGDTTMTSDAIALLAVTQHDLMHDSRSPHGEA